MALLILHRFTMHSGYAFIEISTVIYPSRTLPVDRIYVNDVTQLSSFLKETVVSVQVTQFYFVQKRRKALKKQSFKTK